jgi:signal transduction histidine kinase
MLYIRFIVLTAGTLLPFFWMVVILGHRRQRNFERVFFFLCLALVFFFGASLMDLNAQLYYSAVPAPLSVFCWSIVLIGLWFLPSLLLHLHVEYADVRALLPSRVVKRLWLAAAYLPAILLGPYLYRAVRLHDGVDFLLPANSLGIAFEIWLAGVFIACAAWQYWFGKRAPDSDQRSFHREMCASFVITALYLVTIHWAFAKWSLHGDAEVISATLILVITLSPLVSLIRKVERFNFLQIGRQRHLMFAVFSVFVALLYLSFIRRASLWLDPYVPPEATAAILLFLPVVFFEPLQRSVGRWLRQTAQAEVDRAHRLMGPILELARLGDVAKLRSFAERWIAEQLQLAEVALVLDDQAAPSSAPGAPEEVFAIRQPGKTDGFLRVKPYGAMLSGETFAALEFLAEQLPGALDLCRLIDEKLRLERELAERERLAVLGQMAASISHNLKNPLGSIKTILQLQLENAELPPSLRAETKMVLAEISRLSATLAQLLKFSRPTIAGEEPGAAIADAHAVLEEVLSVLTHEAERRGVALQLFAEQDQTLVSASREAVHDILSNLLLNALESTPRGGHVEISMRAAADVCEIILDDDGHGIPTDLQQKILQPFFTTKTQGTGLGLTIVARRVAEAGGNLNFVSPRENGAGTRCTVTLRLAAARVMANTKEMRQQ